MTLICMMSVLCQSKAAFTLIYILMVYVLSYILIYTYKQLRLYINLYVKK